MGSVNTGGEKVVIFSLTDGGLALAERLKTAIPGATLQHRPARFIDSAQQTFSRGQRCVFICSTGIVVRALAPVLVDKHRDPAVLVLDEAGRFVIPLLSGHEGGACELGRRVAAVIGAQLVITSATDYSRPVYCLGLGTDRGCPAELVEDLYKGVIKELGPDAGLDLIASIDLKQDEAGIVALAERLGLPLHCFPAAELRTVEDRLTEKSEVVFREVGCYGVAEAAALLGATAITGKPSELVVPKRKNSRATIAVARSYA